MSNARPTTNPVGSGSPTGTASPERQAYVRPAAERTPGLVIFAAFMLFILAGFELVFAIVQFSNAAWFASTVYGTFGGRLWLWAIIDVLLALAMIYAGYDLLRGGAFGQYFALTVAAISAVRWFFYIPAEPWAALLIIALDILIIYGIVAHAEYFDGA